MRVLLLGGTDLTLRVAEMMPLEGVDLAGVVSVPRHFSISYRPGGVANVRHVELEAWCREREIPTASYIGHADITNLADRVGADCAVVAGWFHMLPKDLRDRFPLGCLGVHASLLPQLRGGAPLNWAILNGERKTGVTVFELADGVDDGPIYEQRAFPIGARVQVGELVEAATALSQELLRDLLPRVAHGNAAVTPQRGEPSYGLQREPGDGEIDWEKSAEQVDRLVRAVSSPYPGAFTKLDGERITIWETEPIARPRIHGAPGQLTRVPGSVLPSVVTGSGALAILSAVDEGDTDARERLLGAAGRRFRR
jgi:methionyl-tRNA formyltransferase